MGCEKNLDIMDIDRYIYICIYTYTYVSIIQSIYHLCIYIYICNECAHTSLRLSLKAKQPICYTSYIYIYLFHMYIYIFMRYDM